MDVITMNEDLSVKPEAIAVSVDTSGKPSKTTLTFKADGAIIYTDYNDIKHEVLSSSIFLTRLSDGLVDYLSTRDRKSRRGRRPKSEIDDEEEEEEMPYTKPAPLSKKPSFFSPALSKLNKKSNKKSGFNVTSGRSEAFILDRGAGKRKRKAPSWMMQEDFLVDHETVEATRDGRQYVTLPTRTLGVKKEIRDSPEEDDEEDDNRHDDVDDAPTDKGDVLGFKSWVSGYSKKSESEGGRDQSPPPELKEKISKPFACGVCQRAFAEALELQDHIRETHDTNVSMRRKSQSEKKKSVLADDTQTVKCDKCEGWFSARGIERHKTVAHGGQQTESSILGQTEKVEATSTTPESGRTTAGSAVQCHLCNFRAVTADQLAKHLKYTHKVEEGDEAKGKQPSADIADDDGGGGAQQPVIDIRPEGNKIYIDTHGLNLQPEDAARICSEVMTIPDNAEIIILK